MAKGRKTGGRNFRPGVSGNPGGRPVVPFDVRSARETSRVEFERILHRLAFLPLAEVKELTTKPDTSIIEMITAKILITAYQRGDPWRADFILDRMIGKVSSEEPRDVTPPLLGSPPPKKTFSEFCAASNYPMPYPKQIEMYDFGFTQNEPRMLLGARGYGKTDYLTILGVAYAIYMNPTLTFLVITKSKNRNTAIIEEIAKALIANGMSLEKQNSTCLRIQGHSGKDHSVETLTIKSSFRGRHPDCIIMDDPVTEEDVSEAMRLTVNRKYNEAFKLCANILIIGQPAHAHDLYAKLRPLLVKMEIPHGSIPELDHDLEAQRLAGVDEKSIQASYFLKIISDGTAPFESIRYLDSYPVGDSVAFIDPSHMGGDYTALTILRAHFQGVAVVGFVWKKAWNHCLDEMVAKMIGFKVRRVCFETNALGDQPVIMLRSLLSKAGIGVVGKPSNTNKHSRIMAAGAFSHLIHLSKESDRVYTDQVVQYEYDSKHDDAPDSLASCLEWIGLIRGKQ